MARRRSFALAYSQGTTPIQPDIMIFSAIINNFSDGSNYWSFTGVVGTFADVSLNAQIGAGMFIPVAGTFSLLTVRSDSNNADTSKTVGITVGTGPSSLQVTIANGQSGGTDSTDSLHVNAGDQVAFYVPNGIAATGIASMSVSVKFVPD